MAFNGIACSNTVSYSGGSPTASGWPSMGSPAVTQCHTVKVHPQNVDGLQWDRLQQQCHTVEVHPQHLDGPQWDRLQQHSVIQWRFTHSIWMAFNGIACSNTVSYSEGSPTASGWPSMGSTAATVSYSGGSPTASGWPSMGSPAVTQCHTVEVHPQHLDGLQWDRLQQHSVIQ